MALSKKFIGDEMKMNFHMDGCVNGHYFTVKGEGNGKPYEGTQTCALKVTMANGGPLPFSFDILSSAFQSGNRCFTRYPTSIPDYFKQAFPDGMSYERTFTFEDGGVATASGEISLKGNSFEHKSMFHGVNFPADGPVMTKKTTGWDLSFEKMTVCDGILKGDVTMFLMLQGGGNYKCQFHTSYKTKKAVTMPPNHVVEHRIVRTDLDKAGNSVQLTEHAVAHITSVNPF